LAARSHRKRARRRRQARELRRRGRGFRRRPLDHHGGDRGSGAGGRAVGGALYPVPLAAKSHFCGKNPLRHAQGLWRPRRAESQTIMTAKAATTTARPADPCCLVIFGASGDLTHRLLVPALYNLEVSGLLPEAFALIGVARSESSGDAFRADLEKSLPRFATRKIDAAAVKKLLACVAYVQGDPG